MSQEQREIQTKQPPPPKADAAPTGDRDTLRAIEKQKIERQLYNLIDRVKKL